MAGTNVTIRIKQDTKREFEGILKRMGLDMATGFDLFITEVVRQKRIPFEIVADPFYSKANQARLEKAARRMKKTGGTVHELVDG